jgi:hypothetical protein
MNHILRCFSLYPKIWDLQTDLFYLWQIACSTKASPHTRTVRIRHKVHDSPISGEAGTN